MSLISDAKNLYVVSDRITIKDYTRDCVNYWLSRDVVPMLEQVAEDLFDSDEFTLYSYSESKELVSNDQLEMISVYDFAKNVQNLISFNMPDDEEDFYELKRIKNMKLMIKENYDHESTYYVESYYDGDFRGLEDDFNSDDFSEVMDWIWEKLNKGGFVLVTDNVSGQNAKLALPDDSEYYDYIDPNDCIIWSSKYGENIDLNTNLYDLLQ